MPHKSVGFFFDSAGSATGSRRLRGGMDREVDGEHRPLPAIVGKDIATRLLDDAIDGGKAEPGALANFLGGEEGLEDLGNDLDRDATAGIGDLKAEI